MYPSGAGQGSYEDTLHYMTDRAGAKQRSEVTG